METWSGHKCVYTKSLRIGEIVVWNQFQRIVWPFSVDRAAQQMPQVSIQHFLMMSSFQIYSTSLPPTQHMVRLCFPTAIIKSTERCNSMNLISNIRTLQVTSSIPVLTTLMVAWQAPLLHNATNKSKVLSVNWSPAPVRLDHADWPVDGAGLRVGHHLLHGFRLDKLEMEMWWGPGTDAHREQNMKADSGFNCRISLISSTKFAPPVAWLSVSRRASTKPVSTAASQRKR